MRDRINLWLKQYPVFFSLYAVIFAIGLVLLLLNEHGDIIFWWSAYRNEYISYYFGFMDRLGEEYGYILIGIYFLWLIPYRAIGVALTGIIVSVITQIAKAYFASPRPKILFSDQIDQMNAVDGWHMVSGYNSFPSGHTSAGFALAAFLCYFIPRKGLLQALLLIGAASVGLARIYGANHFLVDVVAGSLVGIGVGFFTAYYSEMMIPSKWKSFRWIKKRH